MHLQGRAEERHVVVLVGVQFGEAPQLVAVVVLVDQMNPPAVLVDVEGAALVDVRGAVLERGVDHPYTMQFVASEVRVDVSGLQHVLDLVVGAGDLVAVVRDVHLLLANQLPVVAIGGAVVHAEVVVGPQRVGGGAWIVIRHARRQTHAPLAGVVGPGLARVLDLVGVVVDQQDAAGQTGRILHDLQEVQQTFGVALFRLALLVAVEEVVLVIEAHQVVVTAGGDGGLRPGRGVGITVVGGEVIPDGFQAVLRNREWRAAGGAFEAVAVFHQIHLGGVGLGFVIEALRHRGAAMRREHAHLPVRIALEHRDLARRQVLLVLRQVGLADRELGLFAGVGVRIGAAGLETRLHLGEASIPGGNRAVGIAGLLGADRRQAGAELGGLVGGHGGVGAAGSQQQAAEGQHHLAFHSVLRAVTIRMRTRR